MIEGFSHIMFLVADLDKAAYFFRQVFDAEEIYSSGRLIHSLSEEKYFLIGNLWVVIMEGKPLVERSYNHLAFRIDEDEFERYSARIQTLGLDIRPPRPRVEGEGKSLYFYDYDNHLFELHTGSLKERLDAYKNLG